MNNVINELKPKIKESKLIYKSFIQENIKPKKYDISQIKKQILVYNNKLKKLENELAKKSSEILKCHNKFSKEYFVCNLINNSMYLSENNKYINYIKTEDYKKCDLVLKKINMPIVKICQIESYQVYDDWFNSSGNLYDFKLVERYYYLCPKCKHLEFIKSVDIKKFNYSLDRYEIEAERAKLNAKYPYEVTVFKNIEIL